MIVLDQVSLAVRNRGQRRSVLSSANLVIPSDRRIALLGPSIEDKTSLINLLGGLLLPRSGRVIRKVNVSFPVGHLGSFVSELPVRINVMHLARLYDADVQTVVNCVERFAELGTSFDEPYKLLTSQQKRHLSRIVAYSIPFELYVLTEEIVRGRKKDSNIAYELFQARSRTAGMIIPIHNPQFARDHCDIGMVLDGGKLLLYDHIDKAIGASQRVLEHQGK